MPEDRDEKEPLATVTAADKPIPPTLRKGALPSRVAEPPVQKNARIGEVGSDEPEKDVSAEEDAGTSKYPATFRQQVSIFLFLLLTIPLLYGGGCALGAYQGEVNREVQAKWELPEGVVLKPGPTTFRYDEEKKLLFHRGSMSEKDKEHLVSLLQAGPQAPAPKEVANSNKSTTANRAKPPAASSNDVSNSNKSTATNSVKASATNPDEVSNLPAEPDRSSAIQSFGIAIGDLAYLATSGNNSLLYLLLVAGIAGSVGAQLRSASSFIYASKNGRLDVVLYWPWYLLRPLIGFVVGVIVVVLVKSGFFMSSDSGTQGDMWWLGLAIIVGFGAEGFTDKLYQLGKTIFGEGSPGSKPDKHASEAGKDKVPSAKTKGGPQN